MNEFLDRWLRTAAKPKLRDKSYESYESLLRRYIRPVLGERILSAVTPLDVQDAYQKMIDRGLSARTVRYTHSVLRSAIRQAIHWFWAAYLMTTDKRGVSALLLQRQLGLSSYETAWMMLHRLRRAMVNAARDPLRGEVEVDDTWVGGEQAGLKGSRQLKDRRAALVLVAVEKRGRASGRARMNVIPDFKASKIIPVLTRNVAPGSTIYTDGLKSFSGLVEAGFEHVTHIQSLRSELRKGAKSAVPLADRAIGNLQQWLIGTYHGVSKAQLQVYLDEFIFRHNRRKTPAAAFQTLLGLGTGQKSTEYEQIRGARDLNHN